jgi:benzodiazapine receptor
MKSGAPDIPVRRTSAAAVRLVVAWGVSLSAGLIGSLVVSRGDFRTWYPALAKPAFTPPSWVFGPVWTALYLLMGTAAFLVWQKGGRSRAGRISLGCFLVQLALNALWTPVFFGLHRIGGALVVVVSLWVSLVVTIGSFLRVSVAAALLLVPYLLWVSFATALNAALWRLNR